MSMTRDDVMRLSGRELDVAVAERVMGWTWKECHIKPRYPDQKPYPGQWVPPGKKWKAPPWDIPRYSTDIARALEVVERLATPDECITITYVKGDWVVAVDGAEVVASSKSAPEAICHAALLSALKRSEAMNGGDGA